jgi:hypothetical protein
LRRILGIALLAVLLPGVALAQFMQIGGVVVTSRGMPIPGCIVQLMSADVGPSYPISTGPTGEYYFPQVPTRVNSLYTIQVRWDGNVIFNGIIRGPGIQPPIVIPTP